HRDQLDPALHGMDVAGLERTLLDVRLRRRRVDRHRHRAGCRREERVPLRHEWRVLAEADQLEPTARDAVDADLPIVADRDVAGADAQVAVVALHAVAVLGDEIPLAVEAERTLPRVALAARRGDHEEPLARDGDVERIAGRAHGALREVADRLALGHLRRRTELGRLRQPELRDVERTQAKDRPPGLVTGGADVGEVLRDRVEPGLGGEAARSERVDGPVHRYPSLALMPPLRASEVPRRLAARRRCPPRVPGAGRQILPSRSPRAPCETDLEVAEEACLGRVFRRRLATALAAEPEPSRQLRQRAGRRGRRAWRSGVRLSLGAL